MPVRKRKRVEKKEGNVDVKKKEYCIEREEERWRSGKERDKKNRNNWKRRELLGKRDERSGVKK